MSAPTTKAPVVRSHSTSSRPSRATSELPHRTRSVAVRPSNTAQPPPGHSSHSKTSHDRRPPSNHAQLDSVARRDLEASNVARVPSRREASSDRSQERPSTARTESARRHQRNPSSGGRQRDSVDMTPSSNVQETLQDATATNAAAATAPPRRRTTITTPTGQWALGKTIGAGSMGKVKLAKNTETGEQVCGFDF